MLALEYDVSRKRQDEYGLLSHMRAATAQREGRFEIEIMPIAVGDPQAPVNVAQDDGIRHRVTAEQMSVARPAFEGIGDQRSTGLNSSQVTDGAAMMMLMRRAWPRSLASRSSQSTLPPAL